MRQKTCKYLTQKLKISTSSISHHTRPSPLAPSSPSQSCRPITTRISKLTSATHRTSAQPTPLKSSQTLPRSTLALPPSNFDPALPSTNPTPLFSLPPLTTSLQNARRKDSLPFRGLRAQHARNRPLHHHRRLRIRRDGLRGRTSGRGEDPEESGGEGR